MSLGSFRALSPLNADSHNNAQSGDHNTQVEISQSAYISSHLQQSFGDRGDHISEEALREFQFPEPVSSVRNVDLMSEAVVAILPAADCSIHPDVKLTDKPVQPEVKETGSDPATKSCSKYESGDAGHSLSDVIRLTQITQNTLPNSASSTDKRLNWETLFMPHRRTVDTAQTEQSVPVVAEEIGNLTPTNMTALHRGLSETIATRHYSEDDIIRPDNADNTLVNNTSIWVIMCDVLVTVIKFMQLQFLCVIFVIFVGDIFTFNFFLSKL